MANPIVTALADVIVGVGRSFKRLSVTPLIAREAKPAIGCITLDDALAAGDFEITEVSEAGRVPELKVINGGARPVLLLDGEELVGAKQNRIVNLTILVPARATVLIPVSCVEAWRWSRRSPGFKTSGNAQYSRARAQKLVQVSRSLGSAGVARGDQRWIWDDIAAKSARLAASSETAAMSKMFEVHRQSVEGYVKALPWVAGQVGGVFAIDGAPVGLDLFDCAELMKALLPKILRSYALDAIDVFDAGAAARSEPRVSVEAFINRVADSAVSGSRRFPTVGLGETARIDGAQLAAAALVVHERVVHLAAFEVAV